MKAARETVIEGADSAFVVTQRRLVADNVVELTLQRVDRGQLPAWKAGAHIDVALSSGVTRQYSLHGDPDDRKSWIISVLREESGRGGSLHLHDQVVAGSMVQVTALRNNFPLVAAARYIFIAGGIGITPLIPMVQAASASGAEWTLYYGGRNRASMAHLDVLESLGDCVVAWPQDEKGLLELATILDAPGQAMVYCCGPEPLLKALDRASADWPSGSIRTERFVAAHVEDEVLSAFEVELTESGTTYEIPADKSIMQVLEEAGMTLSKSCGEGTCGSCEIEVLAGIPLHRDSVLSEEEREANETMMICVSRAVTDRLELEL